MKKLLIAMMVFITGCGILSVNPVEVYIIEEGLHDSAHPNLTVSPRHIAFKAQWNDHHLYDLLNENQGDINKLYGITSAKIHQNSARIGWRAKGDLIEVFAYWYKDGERGWHKLGNTHPRSLDTFEIDVRSGQYLFRFISMDHEQDVVYIVPDVDKKYFLNSYISYPYFGGDETAPHKMIFKIYRL